MQWWSWILVTISLSGMFLAGHHRKVGWLVAIAGQLAWTLYGWHTGQWGFVWAAPLYVVAYGRNWWRWRKRERDAAMVKEVERNENAGQGCECDLLRGVRVPRRGADRFDSI